MSAKKTRNASAVQISASTATDANTPVLGIVRGHCTTATGAYPAAQTPNAAAITPTDGSPDSKRGRIAGPTAQQTATTAIFASGRQPVARTSRPTIVATPARPNNSPGR